MGERHHQGYNLDQGVALAQQARLETPQRAGGKQQRGDEKDAEVAAEDQNRDVPGHQARVRQDQEQRAQQELVGDGIHILTQLCMLMQPPRQQAIESVADACEHKQGERRLVPAVKNLDDQKWDDKEAE